MADQYTTTRRNATGRPLSFGGKDAGKDEKYADEAETKAKAEREAFDKEMGWSGLGGASKKPLGATYEKQLSAWREKRKPKAPAPAATISSSEAADALEKRERP